MTMPMLSALSLLIFFFSLSITLSEDILYEDVRVEEYHRLKYTWPPSKHEYRPSTDGWQKIFEERLFPQIDLLSIDDNCYNAYVIAIHAALTCPNFTETGWGITRLSSSSSSSSEFYNYWNDTLKRGLAESTYEAMEEAIETQNEELRPLFVRAKDDIMYDRALQQVQPIVEAWSGIKVVPHTAFGLRIYQNTSLLHMHTDRLDTHILSAIVHIDSDGDNPWPLVIEDYQGVTNEINLTPGDILLYESSKCLHGRPIPFRGKYYSSLFLHYYPVDYQPTLLQNHTRYRVPPHWKESVTILTSKLSATSNGGGNETNQHGTFHPQPPPPQLEFIDTFAKEPSCEYNWCGLQNSKKWYGPAPPYGQVLSYNGIVDLVGLTKQDGKESLLSKNNDNNEIKQEL